MRRLLRTLRLAVMVNRQAKLKFLLLSSLIAISMLIFLVVTELSRASSDSLGEAIDQDLGWTGTYRVEVNPGLNLTRERTVVLVKKAVADELTRPMLVAEMLPPTKPECPPLKALGELTPYVILEGAAPEDPSASDTIPTQGDLCLGGLTVPREAIRPVTKPEGRLLGAGIVLDQTYMRLVKLTSIEPSRLVFVLTTGKDEDVTDQVQATLQRQFASEISMAGLTPSQAFVTGRVDSGSRVRAASNGVSAVYLLIGWGVLLIGGLGILVSELIVLRDRTWFFGLTRAVGAKRSDVAHMVLMDITLVLAGGVALALVGGVLTQPAVSGLGREAFNVDLQLLRPAALIQLFLGVAAMLIVAGAYPAWRATRLDPLDVLERR